MSPFEIVKKILNRRARKKSRSIFSLLICVGIFSPLPLHAGAGNVEIAGDILQVAIPATAYGTTFYLDDQEGRIQFYKSFFTNLAVTYGLKYTINERRPNGGSLSFPSGHTSAAFQGAAFIQDRYGWEYSLPAYTAAAFVGYSRIESNKHYFHDVFAGAIIGTISSLYFTYHYKKFVFFPIIDKDYYGLAIKTNW